MTPFEIRADDDAKSAVYHAFWRWHFYAGLLVMPILMLMALTGGLYLFKDEIDAAIYHRLLFIPEGAAATSPQAWADAAARTFGGRLADPSPGTPAGPWLRTGDLGVMFDDELFIVGGECEYMPGRKLYFPISI